jgi:hypothetical protein
MTRDGGDLSVPTAPPPDCGDGSTVPRDDQSNELLNCSEQLLTRPNRKNYLMPSIPTRKSLLPGSLPQNPQEISKPTRILEPKVAPVPPHRMLRSGFEPASTGVPGFRAHLRHFTNRSATKTSDAMFPKKKGMRHPVGEFPSCHHLKRHIRHTFCRPNRTLTAATMDIHCKHHGLSSQRSHQY